MAANLFIESPYLTKVALEKIKGSYATTYGVSKEVTDALFANNKKGSLLSQVSKHILPSIA